MAESKNVRMSFVCLIFWYALVFFNTDIKDVQSCTFSISPTTVTAPINGLPDPNDPRGAQGVSLPRVTITASNEQCGWTASTNSTWIQLLASEGKGNGSIQYKVKENNTGDIRIGTIQVAGKTVTIKQLSSTVCTFSVSPKRVSVHEQGLPETTSDDPRGGAQSPPPKLNITASKENCQWMASTDSSWIRLLSSKGRGSGYVEYTVMENTSGSPRTGTINVEGRTVKITQEYSGTCILSVSPTTVSLPWHGTDSPDPRAGAQQPPFELTVNSNRANCPWTATTNASWIRLMTSSGNGNGSVQYRVIQNNTGSNRIGTIKVANRTVKVKQEAATAQ